MSKKEDAYIKENRPRWDAQSLAEAEKIKADPARVKAAAVAAKQMVEDTKKEQAAMQKVASKAASKPAPASKPAAASKPSKAPSKSPSKSKGK